MSRHFASLNFILFLLAAMGHAQVRLQGAGASFPNPLYQRWVSEFEKVHPDIQIDYQAIGSGGGVSGITNKVIDFAGSDAPLNAKELVALGGANKVLQFPSTAGAIAIAVNIPGVHSLRLSGPVIAAIYLGLISNWNDPQLAAINPGLSLPDLIITPVYRTDGSGTNFVFSSYLCTQSDDFRDYVGRGKQVKWPLGQGGKGSDGATSAVLQSEGAIGYIEQAYADQNHLTTAAIQNKTGAFVSAKPESITAAGLSATAKMNGTVLAADIWNSNDPAAYPIASFTYLIAYLDLQYERSAKDAASLATFLNWTVGDGQSLCSTMGYAPLAAPVREKTLDALKHLTYRGHPLEGQQ